MYVKKNIKVDYKTHDCLILSIDTIHKAIDNNVVQTYLFKDSNNTLKGLIGKVTSVYINGDNLFIDIETEKKIERPEIILGIEFIPYCSICGEEAFDDEKCSHWFSADKDFKIIVKNISLMTFSVK